MHAGTWQAPATRGLSSINNVMYQEEQPWRVCHMSSGSNWRRSSSRRFHGDVPERLKELAIITAAREANNDYVWTAHERLARQQGVTDPIINAIRTRTAPDGLTGDDAKVVRFAKELLTAHEIADATFNAMHQMLGNKGIMDLILLILYYHSLAHALQAVKLEMPPGTPSTL